MKTEVEHSKSYKSQVRAAWSVNCFTERRDLAIGYREKLQPLYPVRGGVGSMLPEFLSLSKCVIFPHPISDLSDPLLKREKPQNWDTRFQERFEVRKSFFILFQVQGETFIYPQY